MSLCFNKIALVILVSDFLPIPFLTYASLLTCPRLCPPHCPDYTLLSTHRHHNFHITTPMLHLRQSFCTRRHPPFLLSHHAHA
ncbi:hypothetical protein K435DRAFT_399250 [Dendrothele bispora CBS 962.96]|uniref:Secreted protein n=1 Tax=Dendrothele bispora (strain CBS 962.96) TaxID=1314807 RepID=A0A4S8MFU2_DENBC|nr:hypothetical protein K435DRAFT_399250 [Dendrothele bispora CBS 962.96]